MNSIENPVALQKNPDDQYMGIYDAICMAVVIDGKCSLKSSKHKVIECPMVTIISSSGI